MKYFNINIPSTSILKKSHFRDGRGREMYHRNNGSIKKKSPMTKARMYKKLNEYFPLTQPTMAKEHIKLSIAIPITALRCFSHFY